jgi:hypothetical protein
MYGCYNPWCGPVNRAVSNQAPRFARAGASRPCAERDT